MYERGSRKTRVVIISLEPNIGISNICTIAKIRLNDDYPPNCYYTSPSGHFGTTLRSRAPDRFTQVEDLQTNRKIASYLFKFPTRKCPEGAVLNYQGDTNARDVVPPGFEHAYDIDDSGTYEWIAGNVLK